MPRGPTSEPFPAVRTDRRRWSLERRLPLLILALLASVMAVFGAAAYREVRDAAVSRSTERLERVARELGITSARSGLPRLTALQGLARHPAIVEAVSPAAGTGGASADRRVALPLRGPTAEDSALRAALRTVDQANDTTLLGWELWGADGVRRHASATTVARDSAVLATVRAAAISSGTVQRSPMFGAANGVHIWTVLPVMREGRTVGVIAELRRLGNSVAAEATIRELTGEDVRLLFTSAGSDEWASLRGQAVTPPFTEAIGEDTARLVKTAEGEPTYVVQSRIAGTPWRIVLLQPRALVLDRSRVFLRRLLMFGAALLLLGTLGAWLLGRHVARPLRRVTDAAAALSTGDYSQRVRVVGSTEVAGLAATFNAMASRLGDAHATLAEQNAALQRANAAKQQFLAMMSHELRTPLNAIGGYTELLEMGLRGPVTDAQSQDLARIRRNKDHLLAVIGDLLTVSRADGATEPLQLENVVVAGSCRDAIDAMAPLYESKGVRLRATAVPLGLHARGSTERIQQVLLNLLTNALKFTEPGGEVSLECEARDDVVLLRVKDTGIGIPEDRLGDIFEPFVQIDGSLTRRAGGAGLGLAIARNLATAMQGSVEVESTPGSGSVFTLTLPRVRAESGARVAVG